MPLPAAGVVLVSPDGAVKHAAAIGADPVAVIVSDDGSTAFVADSAPGDVYAAKLPTLTTIWAQHVGGAPFGLLLHAGRLLVSLYSGGAVVELDPGTGSILARDPIGHDGAGMTVDPQGGVVVASDDGYLIPLHGAAQPGNRAFSAATVAGGLWTADYPAGEISRSGDPASRRALPDPLHPFWVAPGADGTLLISAEGAHEDSDPGGVYAYDVGRDQFTLLDQALDPDQVVQWGPAILVAAHGSKQVDVIDGGHVKAWAKGAAAVALAPDSNLDLLVVVVNSHE